MWKEGDWNVFLCWVSVISVVWLFLIVLYGGLVLGR